MRTLTLTLFALCLLAPAAAAQPMLAAGRPASAGPATEPSTYVVLRSGEMLRGAVQLFPSAERPEYAVVDGRRFELNEITSFRTADGAFGVATHPLFGTSVLLHQTEAGRVNTYEAASDGLVFLQKGDGPMLAYTNRNLRQLLSDDPEAMRHLNRQSTYQKVGYASLIAGAALVAAGAYFQFDGKDASGPWDSAIVVAGSGLVLASSVNLVLPIFQERANRQALAAYNR